MQKTNYDPNIRRTEGGRRLYELWKRLRKSPHDPAWDDFQVFYTWVMKEGYVLGSGIRRKDDSLPYGPTNAVLRRPTIAPDFCEQEWCEKWDKTVNILRKHFGLPPLKGGQS